ncbi:MAG: 2Fe-2S iron-sulfur cluster-binding protein [Clostridiaceae bacterium]
MEARMGNDSAAKEMTVLAEEHARPAFHILLHTGETFSCRADESVFSAMRRASVGGIKSGCQGGGCGICKMRVHRGSVCAFQPMSRAHVTRQEQSENTVLLCCVYPQSDLVLAPADGNRDEFQADSL